LNNIGDIYGSCILVVFVAAIGLWIIFRREARTVVSLVAPYFIAGIMMALFLSMAEMLYGLSLRENLIELTWNLTLCFRNSVFAVVGLTLFGIEGSLRPLKKWDAGSRYFIDIPIDFSFLAIGGYATFSILWYYAFINGSTSLNVPQNYLFGSLIIVIEAAIVEELFRLFFFKNLH